MIKCKYCGEKEGILEFDGYCEECIDGGLVYFNPHKDKYEAYEDEFDKEVTDGDY